MKETYNEFLWVFCSIATFIVKKPTYSCVDAFCKYLHYCYKSMANWYCTGIWDTLLQRLLSMTDQWIILNDCKMQWVLSSKEINFPYPLGLTLLHMVFSSVLCFILTKVLKVSSLINILRVAAIERSYPLP